MQARGDAAFVIYTFTKILHEGYTLSKCFSFSLYICFYIYRMGPSWKKVYTLREMAPEPKEARNILPPSPEILPRQGSLTPESGYLLKQTSV